ncbi:MAG: FtsX-like permease family protein [Lachnospiraceae bacterium]|nr:FtsX-like permease family protein [Lachnospiraceae bacterium]
MYRYFFIAKNNIKKQKNDMITFFFMSLITGFLLFVSLSYMTGISGVIDAVYEKNHGLDIAYMATTDELTRDKLEEIIKGNPYTGEYEITETMNADSAKYGHVNDRNLSEYPFLFVSYDNDYKIQKISVDTTGLHGNDILIPIRLSTEFATGDILHLEIGDNKYDLKVAGYVEDSLFCSPMNMGEHLVYISDDMYRNILFENSSSVYLRDYHKVRVTKDAIRKRVDTNEVCDLVFAEMNDWTSEYRNTHPDYKGAINNGVPYVMLHGSAMILPLMFIAIVFVFALIIFIISMVIIHFSVKNFIMTNMKNTAIMEASGYTVRELVIILLTQLVSVAALGSLCGVILGALSIEKMSVIILLTLGLPWKQPISTPVAISTIIGMGGLVGALTLLIGREYNKTTVLEALRGGINAHNFKRNFFPFEKSPFSVAVTLSLKETFGRFKNQIGVLFIVMLLSASTLIGLGIADTFSDDDTVINMAGVDYADSMISGDRAMADKLDTMTSVDFQYGEQWQAFNYTSLKVRKDQNITTRCFSDTSNIKGISMAEGRMPVHSNEIMFATNAANRMKVGVGDSVVAKMGTREETYIVTGLCQVINNLGMMSYMTVEGAEKLTGTMKGFSYSVFLKKGYTLKDFEKEIKETYPDIEVTDFKESVQGIIGVVKLGIKAVALVIGILTSLIVAFVESLIIRTQITRSWRNLGVSKALGYTSRQLIFQTMLSNIPVVILGMIPGVMAASFFGGKVLTLMFSIFGFKKAQFFINPQTYVIAIILILGIAMLTSAFIGRRIKVLEPVKMITEE